MNSSIAGGFIAGGPETPPISPLVVLGAENGLRTTTNGSGDRVVQLGEPANTTDTGVAQLLHETFIPMNGSGLNFNSNNFNRVRLFPGSFGLPFGITFVDSISGDTGIGAVDGRLSMLDASGNPRFKYDPATNTFQFSDSSIGSFSTSFLIGGACSGIGRSTGLTISHSGLAGLFNGSTFRNASNANTASTGVQVLNDGNVSLLMQILSSTHTTLGNLAILQASGGAPGLFLASAFATGFIGFSIGNVGPGAGEKMRLTSNGNLGIGVVAPAAVVHTKAGIAGANGAPFQYTSGVAAQTALQNGAKNYDGANEYLTAGGVNYTIAKTLTVTQALNFGSTASLSSTDLSLTLTGAALGDVVVLGVPNGSTTSNGMYRLVLFSEL